MTTEETKVLSIIWDWGGEASVDIIAREAGISTNYARVLCESLEREGCIDFLHSKLCKIKSKGKVMVAERKGQKSRKIVIPERPKGKDKRGRLILTYG